MHPGVQDKWKLFQVGDAVSVQDAKDVMEGYWNVVLQL